MIERIRQAINDRMAELGISRRSLSKKCGITEQMLYLITNKGRNISLVSLEKICTALDLNLEITKTNME